MEIRKIQENLKNFIRLLVSDMFSSQSGNFVNASKRLLEKERLNFSRSSPYYMKTRVYLRYFFHDSLWRRVFWLQVFPDLFKLGLFDNLVTLKRFTQFSFKLRGTDMQKMLKFVLIWWLLLGSFLSGSYSYWKSFKFVIRHFSEG